MQLEGWVEILKVRFTLTGKKAPNSTEFSPEENSDRNLFSLHSVFWFNTRSRFKKEN